MRRDADAREHRNRCKMAVEPWKEWFFARLSRPFCCRRTNQPHRTCSLVLLLFFFPGVKNEETFFGSAISTARRRRDTTRRRPLACVVGECELAGEVNGSREAGGGPHSYHLVVVDDGG